MTNGAGRNDDGLAAIDAAMLADDFRAGEEQRKFDRMLDDYIDGVAYVERDGVTFTEDGRLYEPLDNTPLPGAGDEFLAEQRAKAIYAGEPPPASLEELHAASALPEVEPVPDYQGRPPALDRELQRIIDVNKRNFPTSATEIRAPGKHAERAGRRYRAPSPQQGLSTDHGYGQ